MKRVFIIICATVSAACSVKEQPIPENIELAMKPGMIIEATTSQGKITISYVDTLTRQYSWDGITKTFKHQPREKRWYGSLGMYRPVGDGTMHAVLEEGQQHFSTVQEAYLWIKGRERFVDCVWTKDGLVMGWRHQSRPGDGYLALSAEVWQVFVNGRKANLARGASGSNVRISFERP